ncbi:MAG: hypothetical protein P8R42_05415 [Candidatus Binatia bacterium]|nr:hypothetical protein [Candidatus Binatia bacterium]
MLAPRNPVLWPSLLMLIALIAAAPADAENRIRLRSGGDRADTITIDETAEPPMITVSSGVTVRGGPGTVRAVGGGKFQILVPGNVTYHLKARGGVDTITVVDGPGSSTYWLGAGAESDFVFVQDGPGDDRYKLEGKGGDDTYEVFDDAGDGNDYYYLKGASGADRFGISDGAGDDTYKLRGSAEADLTFTDADGDLDVVKVKGIELEP